MPALHQSENGTFVLYPWCMPRSCDVDGEPVDRGRFAIAYSRDGWFLLDTETFTMVRWCVSEEDAVAAREELLRGRQ